jgi:hypothetical protein
MKECLSEEILQQYFDGELEGSRMESAAFHLAGCEACASSLRELESETNFVATALAPEFDVVVPTEHLQRRIDQAIAGLDGVRSANSHEPSAWHSWLAALSALVSLSPQRVFAYGGLVAIVVFATIFGIIRWQSLETQPVPENQVAVTPKTLPEAAVSPEAKLPQDAVEVSVPEKTALKKPARKNQPATPHSGPSSQAVAEVKLLPGERSYLKTIAALDTTIKSGNATMRPALQAEYERNLALVDRAIAATRSAAKRNPNDPDTADFMFAAYQSKVDLLNTIADARVYNRQR